MNVRDYKEIGGGLRRAANLPERIGLRFLDVDRGTPGRRVEL